MNKLLATAFFIFSLYGCSSSRLVDEYRNAETPNFQANKVLVVGLTSDPVLQRQFEYSLQQALETEDVIAVKSVDYFESTFSEILIKSDPATRWHIEDYQRRRSPTK